MENYMLIVLVALFVGVVGIVIVLERWRRAALMEADKIRETLAACLESLQTIHSSGESQMSQVVEELK